MPVEAQDHKPTFQEWLEETGWPFFEYTNPIAESMDRECLYRVWQKETQDA